MKKPTSVIVGLLVACLGGVGAVFAGTDWLQQGKELLGGAATSAPGAQDLTVGEIGAGLKEALRIGSENVVTQLGQQGGFNADPAVHIPLPERLESVQSALDTVGMASLLDDLELRLNRAAEQATPKAKQLFVQAIEDMTLDDVRAIYRGPDNAATQYFRSKMSQPLAEEMRPVIDSSLAEVGAVQVYEQAMDQYRNIPFVPDVKADLTDYALDMTLDGVFYYLAQEEAAIRQNPAKQTTDLLKRVFGAS